MQMGRWFGFRKGYCDLVRLYIGDSEPVGTKGQRTVNLISEYRDICRTEEALREELARYIRQSGRERLKPTDIPPLIRLFGGMKITAANKLYYAKKLNKNFGGKIKSSTQAPDPTALNNKAMRGKIEENIRSITSLLKGRAIQSGRIGRRLLRWKRHVFIENRYF